MNYKDENKASSLAKQLIGYDTVMLDTCSLMEDSFLEWLDILKEAKDYLEPGFTLVVPKACYAELKKHSCDRKNKEKSIPAKRALKILKKAKHDRLVSVGKSYYNTNFADNAIYAQACEERITSKILVITQDKKLATDLRNLNKLNSQRGRNISVYKVVPGGKLEYNQGETFQKSNWINEKRSAGYQPNKAPQSNGQNSVPKTNVELSPEEKVLQEDKRLNANLKNPNYPLSDKMADIEKQIEAISKLPESKLKGMHLLQGPQKLKESLAMLKGKKEAVPAKPKTVEQLPKAESDKPAAPLVSEKKEAPKSEMPSILVKAPAKKLWYGEGKTTSSALSMVAEHYGLMFRDPSIPYLSVVHGPIDLTTRDQTELVAKLNAGLATSSKIEFNHSSFRVAGEKDKFGFKVYLDLHPDSSPQNVSEAKGAGEVSDKNDSPAAAPKAKAESSSTKIAVKPAAKKSAKPKENEHPAVKSVPNTSAAVPEGVNLVVGVPTDERKRGYIERSVRRGANEAPSKAKGKTKGESADKPKKEAKKPQPAPVKKAPAKPRAAAAKAQGDSKPKKTGKPKSSPQTGKEKTPTRQSAAKKKKETPASPKKPAAKTKDSSLSPLETVLKNETKLKANIPNANYPSASKKKDLEAQLKLVKKLTKEERAKLTLGPDALAGMISLL